LRIVLMHIILEIPPQIQIWGGFKSGECAAHSISHFLLISMSLNRSLSQARESFVVWGVWSIQVCLQRRGCHLEHILERT
jgi:hypothetical protein